MGSSGCLRASPRWAAGAAAVLVTFYAALAGAGASVIRAAVMADVYLLAVLLDRRADLLNSLALSGLAILWWNPRFLHDVGFQLTYLATLGIILVLPRCQSRLVSLPRPLRWILESVAITVAATAATLPILAGSFNRVSPSGLLANIPIVPLSGLITGLGTAACAIFLAVPTGLAWLNQVNGWLVDALLELARWFGAWSWSTVRVYAPTTGMLLCYYATLAAVLWAWPARPRPVGRGRFSRSAVWVSVGCCALLAAQILWRLYPAVEDSRVRLTMLDVGQGEAIYLEVPGRSNMLVDAGGMLGEGFDIGQRVIVPFLWHEWVNRLDVVVLTHPQSDHIGGAPTILREVTVGEVWTGGSPATSATDVWIQEYLRHRRIPHRVVAAGDPPLRWGHAVVQVIHPAVEDGGAPPIRLGREPGPNDLIGGLARAERRSGDPADRRPGAEWRGGPPWVRSHARGAGPEGTPPRVSPVQHRGLPPRRGPCRRFGLRRPPQSVPAPAPGNRGPIPDGGHSCLADGSKWCDQRGDAARGDTGPGPAGGLRSRALRAGHHDRQEAIERSQRAAAC